MYIYQAEILKDFSLFGRKVRLIFLQFIISEQKGHVFVLKVHFETLKCKTVVWININLMCFRL